MMATTIDLTVIERVYGRWPGAISTLSRPSSTPRWSSNSSIRCRGPVARRGSPDARGNQSLPGPRDACLAAPHRQGHALSGLGRRAGLLTGLAGPDSSGEIT
jgi:hypothetical protein